MSVIIKLIEVDNMVLILIKYKVIYIVLVVVILSVMLIVFFWLFFNVFLIIKIKLGLGFSNVRKCVVVIEINILIKLIFIIFLKNNNINL